jgi:hypothetical protein
MRSIVGFSYHFSVGPKAAKAKVMLRKLLLMLPLIITNWDEAYYSKRQNQRVSLELEEVQNPIGYYHASRGKEQRQNLYVLRMRVRKIDRKKCSAASTKR